MISTPFSFENTRSTHSSSTTLVAWSQPLNRPCWGSATILRLRLLGCSHRTYHEHPSVVGEHAHALCDPSPGRRFEGECARTCQTFPLSRFVSLGFHARTSHERRQGGRGDLAHGSTAFQSPSRGAAGFVAVAMASRSAFEVARIAMRDGTALHHPSSLRKINFGGSSGRQGAGRGPRWG
eukprot:scaffold24_cov341-Pavlova_lutheri.AAC.64